MVSASVYQDSVTSKSGVRPRNGRRMSVTIRYDLGLECGEVAVPLRADLETEGGALGVDILRRSIGVVEWD